MPPLFIHVDLESDEEDISHLSVGDNDCEMKCVEFALHENVVHFVTHLDDMEEEDIGHKTLWWSRDELKANKTFCIETIQKLNLGLQVEESEHETTRGLTHMTHEGSLRKDFKKRRVQEILREQDRSDELELRRISERYSKVSVKEAWNVAQQDAFFAEEYLAPTRQEWTDVEDVEEIPASLCLNFCSLRRSLTRLGCTLGRSTTTFKSDTLLDRSHERILQVV